MQEVGIMFYCYAIVIEAAMLFFKSIKMDKLENYPLISTLCYIAIFACIIIGIVNEYKDGVFKNDAFLKIIKRIVLFILGIFLGFVFAWAISIGLLVAVVLIVIVIMFLSIEI